MDFWYCSQVGKKSLCLLEIQAEICADGNDIMTEIWLKIIEKRRGEPGQVMS